MFSGTVANWKSNNSEYFEVAGSIGKGAGVTGVHGTSFTEIITFEDLFWYHQYSRGNYDGYYKYIANKSSN